MAIPAPVNVITFATSSDLEPGEYPLKSVRLRRAKWEGPHQGFSNTLVYIMEDGRELWVPLADRSFVVTPK